MADSASAASVKCEHLYLEVTSRCDLRCDHCSVRSWGRPVPDPEYDVLAGLLAGFRDQGGRYVTLSGGEPGLRPDLAGLITDATALGLDVTLFTNGLAATSEVLEQLEAARGRMAVSVDGPSAQLHEALRGPGTFDVALSSLKRAVCGLGGDKVVLSCVLSRPLLPHTDHLWEFSRVHGVGVLYLGVFEPLGPRTWHPLAPTAHELVDPVLRLLEAAEGDPEVRLLFSESHDLFCVKSVFSGRDLDSALGRTVKVQADGWALPGPFFYDPRFRLGRPAEQGWTAVLCSDVYEELRHQACTRVLRVAACAQCFWSHRCGGGSLALTWAAFGTWGAACPLCEVYQATLRRAARRRLIHAPSACA